MIDNGFDASAAHDDREEGHSQVGKPILFADIDIDVLNITRDGVHAAPTACPHGGGMPWPFGRCWLGR